MDNIYGTPAQQPRPSYSPGSMAFNIFSQFLQGRAQSQQIRNVEKLLPHQIEGMRAQSVLAQAEARFRDAGARSTNADTDAGIELRRYMTPLSRFYMAQEYADRYGIPTGVMRKHFGLDAPEYDEMFSGTRRRDNLYDPNDTYGREGYGG